MKLSEGKVLTLLAEKTCLRIELLSNWDCAFCTPATFPTKPCALVSVLLPNSICLSC